MNSSREKSAKILHEMGRKEYLTIKKFACYDGAEALRHIDILRASLMMSKQLIISLGKTEIQGTSLSDLYGTEDEIAMINEALLVTGGHDEA